MGWKVRFDTNEIIELDKDNYTNCHQFSRAVFLKMAPDGHKYKRALQQAADDTRGITAVYAQMIREGDAKRFEVDQCAAIPSKSLIIFADGQGMREHDQLWIQHSMIAVESDCWTGANNLYSFGTGNTGVENFTNVSQRREQLARYVLYHISF